jgi:hypothetical protein
VREILIRTSGAPAAIIVVEVEAPVRVSLPRGEDRERFLRELSHSPARAAVLAAALAAVERDRAAAWSEELALEDGGVVSAVEGLLVELGGERRARERAQEAAEQAGVVRRLARAFRRASGAETRPRADRGGVAQPDA